MHTNKNGRQVSVSTKQNMLVQSLEHFFTKRKGHQRNMKLFLNLVEKGAKISLRVIDWFVTNYSREKEIVILHDNKNEPNSSSAHFNIHESYKQQLKSYSKRQFDPFCRRKRINFHYKILVNGEEQHKKIKTTVGQLNFFKWAIENNIIHYVQENIVDIEDAMRSFVRVQRDLKRKQKEDNEKKNDIQDKTKHKTRRRSQPTTNSILMTGKSNNNNNVSLNNNNKTLRKGTIVTNRTHTTVFFS